MDMRRNVPKIVRRQEEEPDMGYLPRTAAAYPPNLGWNW